MSATLPNLDLLANWLDADLYQTEYRPVPLAEHIKIGQNLFDASFHLVREIRPEVKINVRYLFKYFVRFLKRALFMRNFIKFNKFQDQRTTRKGDYGSWDLCGREPLMLVNAWCEIFEFHVCNIWGAFACCFTSRSILFNQLYGSTEALVNTYLHT